MARLTVGELAWSWLHERWPDLDVVEIDKAISENIDASSALDHAREQLAAQAALLAEAQEVINGFLTYDAHKKKPSDISDPGVRFLAKLDAALEAKEASHE